MIEVICKICNNKFKVYKYRSSTAQFCSRKCKGKYFATKFLGENNPCWRGGKPKCSCGNEMWYESKKCDKCSRKEDIRNWKDGISLTRAYFRNYEYQSRARRYNAQGSHTQEEWEQLKKTYRNMCLCCKRQEPEIRLERDHIIPIVLDGSNYIWNIQPLCRSCNAIKHANAIDYRIPLKGDL